MYGQTGVGGLGTTGGKMVFNNSWIKDIIKKALGLKKLVSLKIIESIYQNMCNTDEI